MHYINTSGVLYITRTCPSSYSCGNIFGFTDYFPRQVQSLSIQVGGDITNGAKKLVSCSIILSIKVGHTCGIRIRIFVLVEP